MNAENELAFRPADMRDAYALWLWANDTGSRKAAFDRAQIGWTEHVEWLHNAIESPLVYVWVAELKSGQPVGVLRFDTVDDWKSARLSYAVAPEARGQGIGRALIERAPAMLAGVKPGANAFAVVASGNAASLRIFQSLGWEPSRPDESSWSFTFSRSSAKPGA